MMTLHREIENRLLAEMRAALAAWRLSPRGAPQPDGALQASQARDAFWHYVKLQGYFLKFIASQGKVMPPHIEAEYRERIAELERKQPGSESRAATAGRREA